MTTLQQRALLLVLFAASGCAASIYELVWFQLLSLVIGASSVSLGVLLATFMGGLCLGSLFFLRFISKRYHPLRVLALCELGIGAFGLAILYGMPAIAGIYAAWSGSITRAVLASVCLLPPTILMGATLPIIARWLGSTERAGSWLGFFYAANIGGAVAGSLLAGFYLLSNYDVTIATFVAVALNVAVALSTLALSVSRKSPPLEEGWPKAGVVTQETLFTRYQTHLTLALSGLTALSAEVLWTRHLSLLLGATVYTFALILAVFLFGLGIGSALGSTLSRLTSPRTALGYCQLLLCAAIAWGAYAATKSLPYWPIDVRLPSTPWLTFQLDVIRATWAVLPAALLWGASFPLAVAESPLAVGSLYAANTLGAIIGALATTFVLLASLGSQTTHQLLILLSAVAGLLHLRKKHAAIIAAAIAAAVALAYVVPAVPPEFVAYGRFTPTLGVQSNVIYMKEGLIASVAVTQNPDGSRTYHSAGKPQASSNTQDMRLQRMLGHLTTLLPQQRKRFLVIGLGAGVTAGAVSADPSVERVAIAEIEPSAREVASKYFPEHNFRVIDNPKVDLHIDDGRHYLSTTKETFDGITADPLDPWVKGAAALYTREFWELCKSRLNPGGVVTVFVQLYETNEEAVKSEVATFFDVFPGGAVFANTMQGMGYDVVLLGRADDAPIDIGRIDALLQSPAYQPVLASLKQVGFSSAVDLLGTYAGRPGGMSAWMADGFINRDRNLRLQYLAARGLNVDLAHAIFDSMMAGGVKFPAGMFTGPPELLEQLKQIIRAKQGEL